MARQAIESILHQQKSLSFEIESSKLNSERMKINQFTHIVLDQADISPSELSLIRRNQRDAEIILMTPSVEHVETHRLPHWEVDGFLTKPVVDEAFISLVEYAQKSRKNPEIWWFNDDQRALVNEDVNIPLTGIESLMLTQLVISDRRVISKADIIQGMKRDPEIYNGFEMCLSRLQAKFSKAANGERLVRSVRNRGYCLAQKIKMAY